MARPDIEYGTFGSALTFDVADGPWQITTETANSCR